MPLRATLAVLALAVVLTFVGCEANPSLSSIAVTPSTATLTAVGQNVQFTATATYVHGSHPATTHDVTSEVQWSSSAVSVATIGNSGVATAVDAGTTTITASMNGPIGLVTGASTLAVSTPGMGGPPVLVSLSIIPASGTQTVYALGETAQFLAIGTFSASPTTQDLTNSVTWQSADVDVATINSSGLATAVNCFSTTPPCVTNITASTMLGNGTDVVATSSLGVDPNGGSPNLPSLTVYSVGTGTGTVVSSPPPINCGSGTGCTGNFTVNSSVTLTATATSGFIGGWSNNCIPFTVPPNATTATCTVMMSGNQTVGVIFNGP